MPTKDPRIDAVIRDAAPFARPILLHVRKLVHRSCPEVEETLKWGMPFFLYKGKILCSIAPFKAHCRFGFWNGRKILKTNGEKANIGMGQLSVTNIQDLPSAKELASYVKQAMDLCEAGASPKRASRRPRPPARPPADLMRALRADKRALGVFDAFSPTHRREYVEWIEGAKSEETRERRLETAVEWISKGKSRNWKYQRR
jgi:uncharacterized protein YdeI (YjbR/CyaY-like superfamily)